MKLVFGLFFFLFKFYDTVNNNMMGLWDLSSEVVAVFTSELIFGKGNLSVRYVLLSFMKLMYIFYLLFDFMIMIVLVSYSGYVIFFIISVLKSFLILVFVFLVLLSNIFWSFYFFGLMFSLTVSVCFMMFLLMLYKLYAD